MDDSQDQHKLTKQVNKHSRFQVEDHDSSQSHHQSANMSEANARDQNQINIQSDQPHYINGVEQPEESPPRLNLIGAHLNGRTYASEDHEQAMNTFNYSNLQRGQTLISVEAEIPYHYSSNNTVNNAHGNRTIEMVNSTIGTTTEVVDNNPGMDGYEGAFEYNNRQSDDKSFQHQQETFYSPIMYETGVQERSSYQPHTQKNQYIHQGSYHQQSQEESKVKSANNTEILQAKAKGNVNDFNKYYAKRNSKENSRDSEDKDDTGSNQNRFKVRTEIEEDEDNMADREDNNQNQPSNKNSLTRQEPHSTSPKQASEQYTPLERQNSEQEQHPLNSGILQDQEDQVNEADVSSAAIGNDQNDEDKENSRVEVSLTQSQTKSNKLDKDDSFFQAQPLNHIDGRSSRDMRSDQSQVDPESKVEYNSPSSQNNNQNFNKLYPKNAFKSQLNVNCQEIQETKNHNNSQEEPHQRFEKLKEESEQQKIQERFTFKVRKNPLIKDSMHSMGPQTSSQMRGILTAQHSMRILDINEINDHKNGAKKYSQIDQESGQASAKEVQISNNSKQKDQKKNNKSINSALQRIGASPRKQPYQPKVSFAGSDVDGYPKSIMNQNEYDLKMISPHQNDGQFEEEKVSSRQIFGDFRNDSRSISSGKKFQERVGSRSYTSIPFRSNMNMNMNQSRQKSSLSKDNEYDVDASSKGNQKVSVSNGSNLYLIIDKESQTVKHNLNNNQIIERGMSNSRSQKYLPQLGTDKHNSLESEKSQKFQLQEQSLSPENAIEPQKQQKLQVNKENSRIIKKQLRKKSKCSNVGSSIDCEQKGRFLIKNSTDDKGTEKRMTKRKSTDKLSRQESRKRLYMDHGSTSSRSKLDYMKDMNAMYQQLHFQQMSSNNWQDPTNSNNFNSQLGKTPLMIPQQFYLQSPAPNRFQPTASPSKGRGVNSDYLQNFFKQQKGAQQKQRDGYDEDSDSPLSSSENDKAFGQRLAQLKEEEKTDKANPQKDDNQAKKKRSQRSDKEKQQKPNLLQTPMFNLNDQHQLPPNAFTDQQYPQAYNQMYQGPFASLHQNMFSSPNQQLTPYNGYYNQMQNPMQLNQYACMQQMNSQMQHMQLESVTRSMASMFNQMVTSHGQIMTKLIKSVKHKKRTKSSSSSSSDDSDQQSSSDSDGKSDSEDENKKKQHLIKDDSFFKYQPQPLNSQGSKLSKKSKVFKDSNQKSSSKKTKELQAQLQSMQKQLKSMKKKKK